MSMFVKHQAKTPKTVKFALLLGILWVLSLIVIWFAYRNSEGEAGGFFHFIGRFHVLIVHFPIGLIVIAALMEVLSYFTAFSHLSRTQPFMLWLSFLSSIAATVVGFLLMSAEGFSGRAMSLHLYFGLAVVVLALAALVLSLIGKRFFSGLAIGAAAFSTLASGHFGGAMVHEPDYLTEHAPAALKPALMLGLGGVEETPEGSDPAKAAEVPIGERVVYEDLIVPILDKTCNECHNENKIKGKLRMDTHELLLAGAEGSDFPTVVPGNAEESEMIVRVNLPADDDEFMPPKGDPLTPAEIKLLSLWIQAGAKTDTTVAQLGEDPQIAATALEVLALHSGGKNEEGGEAPVAMKSVWETLSPEEQAKRLAEVNEAAEKYNFSIMPISAEDDRLRVNVINAAKEFGDEQLKLLEPVADRIVWLDLARSQVTDTGMKTVRLMGALERLHLENTKVTDAGIAELASLSHLEYLNLYGTKVGNEIFETFATLPKLKNVYLWQTAVDPAVAKSFERSVNLEINTGAELAAPPAPPAPQEIKATDPPKPAAPAKPAEVKPAAAKPAEPKPATPNPAAPKPTEPAKPAAANPAPAKAAETKPAEAKPAGTQPPAPKAAEPKPAAAKPTDTPPAPAKAAETKPAPAKPAEPKPDPAKPATAPASTPPAPAKPVEPKPAAAKPADTPPAPASPEKKAP